MYRRALVLGLLTLGGVGCRCSGDMVLCEGDRCGDADGGVDGGGVDVQHGRETACDDQLDNDQDGQTDCRDADCLGLTCACFENSCRVGDWGACEGDADGGPCTGVQTRLGPVCDQSFNCVDGVARRACPQSGNRCGSASVPGPCTQGSARSCAGTRTRGEGRCETGSCTGSDVKTEACLVAEGTSCGPPGPWSACQAGGGPPCRGVQTRTVHRCSADGGCVSATEQQSCLIADGTACGAPTQLGPCNRSDPLQCTGTRTETGPACQAGECTGTRTTTAACNVAQGTDCGKNRCCGPGVADYPRCTDPPGFPGKHCGSEFYDGECDGVGACKPVRCTRVVCWQTGCGTGGEITTVNLPCPL